MDTSTTIEERQDRVGAGLVWHAEGIAAELDISVHRARYLIRSGKIPVTRLPGSREFFTTKRVLRKIFDV
jgi:hypothetical protein